MAISQSDTDEGVTRGPAEDVGENRLLVVVVLVDTRLEGDEPFLALVERRIDRSGLSDELMELEGQERIARTLFLNVLVDSAHPLEGRLKSDPTTVFWCPRVLGQRRNDIAEPHGHSPNQPPVTLLEGNAVFEPDRHRVPA